MSDHVPEMYRSFSRGESGQRCPCMVTNSNMSTVSSIMLLPFVHVCYCSCRSYQVETVCTRTALRADGTTLWLASKIRTIIVNPLD